MADLRSMCEMRKLQSTGKRKDLEERLRIDDEQTSHADGINTQPGLIPSSSDIQPNTKSLKKDKAFNAFSHDKTTVMEKVESPQAKPISQKQAIIAMLRNCPQREDVNSHIFCLENTIFFDLPPKSTSSGNVYSIV